MASKPVVEVVGLKALNRDLRKLSDERSGPVVDAMKAAGKAAAEPVAAATRSSLPQKTGRLAASVRTSGTKTGAAVRMGTAKIRYAGWLDFGGTRERPHAATRPYRTEGRFLFPAAEHHAAEGARLYEEKVTAALDHFGWSNDTTNANAVHD